VGLPSNFSDERPQFTAAAMKALYKLRAQPLGEVLKGQDRQQYGQKNGRHVTEIEHVPTSLQFHADAAGPNDAEDRGHADVAFQEMSRSMLKS